MKRTAIITILVLLASCTDRYSAERLSDEQIRITADLQELYCPTKANFQTDLNQSNNRMKVYAYKTGTKTMHFSSPAIYYSGNWLFYNDKARGIRYYWPDATHGLDFFAYYPEPLQSDNKYNTYVTVSGSPCSEAGKFTFTCSNLPVTSEMQDGTATDQTEELEEFVYAYKENAVQPTDKEDKNGNRTTVGLVFKHPYARVSFQLTEAIRSTIKTITLTNIYNSGTCTVSSSGASWATSGSKTSFVATVNKSYPDEINNGGIMGGPFLIIPQAVTDNSTSTSSDADRVQLIVSYNTTIVSLDLKKASGIDEWLPGYEYTYKMKLNGAANEVILEVGVNEWFEEGTSETDVK